MRLRFRRKVPVLESRAAIHPEVFTKARQINVFYRRVAIVYASIIARVTTAFPHHGPTFALPSGTIFQTNQAALCYTRKCCSM
jgi:hypothetical protein